MSVESLLKDAKLPLAAEKAPLDKEGDF